MIGILIYSVASMGLAYIVGVSEISYPIRSWLAERGAAGRWLVSMMECPMCWGFHSGFWSALVYPPLATALLINGPNRGLSALCVGLLTTGIHMVAKRLGMFV